MSAPTTFVSHAPYDLPSKVAFGFASKIATGIKPIAVKFLESAVRNPQAAYVIAGNKLDGMAAAVIEGDSQLLSSFINATQPPALESITIKEAPTVTASAIATPNKAASLIRRRFLAFHR